MNSELKFVEFTMQGTRMQESGSTGETFSPGSDNSI